MRKSDIKFSRLEERKTEMIFLILVLKIRFNTFSNLKNTEKLRKFPNLPIAAPSRKLYFFRAFCCNRFSETVSWSQDVPKNKPISFIKQLLIISNLLSPLNLNKTLNWKKTQQKLARTVYIYAELHDFQYQKLYNYFSTSNLSRAE